MKDELLGEIGSVLESILKNATQELLATTEQDLSKYWTFRFDSGKSLEWNIYRFSESLESYKRQMRRWEEHYNGNCCVVERVRDKYLMPKIVEFKDQIINYKNTISGDSETKSPDIE